MIPQSVRTSAPIRASAPFDKANADIILRSADLVEFRLHKTVLALASPVFEDMFDIPQSETTASAGSDVDPASGLPLVPVVEDSKTLDSLLRLCYPTADPELKTLDDVVDVLLAANKYDMTGAANRTQRSLLTLLDNKLLDVYAVACRFNLEDIARTAAEKAKKTSWIEISYVPAMDHISAGALYRLLHFRREDHLDASYTFCRPSRAAGAAVGEEENPAVGVRVDSHQFTHRSADVIVRASDGVEFRVYSSILALASPTFADILDHPPDADAVHEDGSRIIAVPEDSRTVNLLFTLCYPLEEPELDDLHSAHRLLEAAIKYNVASALGFAKRRWMAQMEAHPLRAYCLARIMKWEEEAKEAAGLTIFRPCDGWCPEMEHTPARAYVELLTYRQKCQQCILNVIPSRSVKHGTSGTVPHWSVFMDSVAMSKLAGFTFHQFYFFVNPLVSGASRDSSRAAVLAAPIIGTPQMVNGLIVRSQKLQDQLTEALTKVRSAELQDFESILKENVDVSNRVESTTLATELALIPVGAL